MSTLQKNTNMNMKSYSKVLPHTHPVSFFGCCIRTFDDVTVYGARCGSPYDPVGPGYVEIYINDQYVQTLTGNKFGERFGVSIALNEQYLCVGAYRENTIADNGGSVYVYKRQGTLYELVCLLYAPDKAEKDYFGYNIAIEQNLLVVGAYAKNMVGGEDGKAYLFDLEKQECIANFTSPYPTKNENFGRAVAIFDKTIYVGSHKRNKQGTIFVFDVESNLLEKLQVHGTKGFGNSICVNDNYVMVGAYETNDNGSVCVFDRVKQTWQTITKGSVNSFFGGSLSNCGNFLAIGSYRYGKNEQGAVFIYNLESNRIEQTILPDPDKDWFGYSIHLNDRNLLVGSVKENIVYCYKV